MDQAKQPAAMDAELRNLVSRVEPAQFPPDHLSKAIGQDELARTDAGRVEIAEQPEPSELLHRMRQHVDADAELAHLARALEQLDLDARLMQEQRGSQP